MLPLIIAGVAAAGAAWGATTYTAENVAEAAATEVVVGKVTNQSSPSWFQSYGVVIVVVLLFIAWRRGWL
ncbi:hypothetical protein INR79_01630 [Vibrio sp. SCSIO 43132]|uniref:hypothetical protein n=1 Tax=Vibrio sp. SCSIO 43132 TaxID=2779363 RepID=UPI001CA831DB|nr:hypothetical protein [Vibrio sp. SCSIO 43132]UAB70654.1 hypothetical protein INR79_01630 [Vibrio sp. SCSIO 43132]